MEKMRRKDRELTDREGILRILDRAKILRLALFDGDYPYVVPLHYAYEFSDGSLSFYMHSAKEGHKLDLIRKNPKVCIELDCDVSLISGGDIPCRYGSAYGSLIARGRAEISEDEAEKIKGLKLLMRNQTGRDFDIDERMAASVSLIKVKVRAADFTAKSRMPS